MGVRRLFVLTGMRALSPVRGTAVVLLYTQKNQRRKSMWTYALLARTVGSCRNGGEDGKILRPFCQLLHLLP